MASQLCHEKCSLVGYFGHMYCALHTHTLGLHDVAISTVIDGMRAWRYVFRT